MNRLLELFTIKKRGGVMFSNLPNFIKEYSIKFYMKEEEGRSAYNKFIEFLKLLPIFID